MSTVPEARRHKARHDLANRIGTIPARAALVNLKAAIRGFQEAGCLVEARDTLLPLVAILARWAYHFQTGKSGEAPFGADICLQKLRSMGVLNKEAFKLSQKLLDCPDDSEKTVLGLAQLAEALHSIIADISVDWQPKAARGTEEARDLYSGRIRDPKPTEPAVCRTPTIDDAKRLCAQGQHLAGAMTAYGALLEHLRDLCYEHGCRPVKDPGTWERGFRPSQYATALEAAKVLSEEEAVTIRRLEVLALNIAGFVIRDIVAVKRLIDGVKELVAANPVVAGDPWGRSSDMIENWQPAE